MQIEIYMLFHAYYLDTSVTDLDEAEFWYLHTMSVGEAVLLVHRLMKTGLNLCVYIYILRTCALMTTRTIADRARRRETSKTV